MPQRTLPALLLQSCSFDRQWFAHRNSASGSPRGQAVRQWTLAFWQAVTLVVAAALGEAIFFASSGGLRVRRKLPRDSVLRSV